MVCSSIYYLPLFIIRDKLLFGKYLTGCYMSTKLLCVVCRPKVSRRKQGCFECNGCLSIILMLLFCNGLMRKWVLLLCNGLMRKWMLLLCNGLSFSSYLLFFHGWKFFGSNQRSTVVWLAILSWVIILIYIALFKAFYSVPSILPCLC